MSMWTRKPPEENPSQPTAAPRAAQSTSAPLSPVGTLRNGAVLGASMVVKGEIHGQEDLWIDGQLDGKIDLPGCRITVGPNGKVRAAIRAREVEILGLVEGNVEAAERIIIRRNARLTGDLKMAGVVIEDGAYFKGSIDITQAQAAAAATRPAAAATPSAHAGPSGVT